MSWVYGRTHRPPACPDRPASRPDLDPDTAFYALLPDEHQVGSRIATVIDDQGDQMLGPDILLVTTAPRCLPLTEATAALNGDEDLDLEDLLGLGDRLAVLAPAGPVIPTDTNLPHLHMTRHGWTITGWASLDLVLGPQAAQLRTLAHYHRGMLDGSWPGDMATYGTALNAQYDGRIWTGRPHADAAQDRPRSGPDPVTASSLLTAAAAVVVHAAQQHGDGGSASSTTGALYLVGVAVAAFAGWRISLWLRPWRTCTRCDGQPRDYGAVYTKAFSLCSRCGGTGRHLRWGAKRPT